MNVFKSIGDLLRLSSAQVASGYGYNTSAALPGAEVTDSELAKIQFSGTVFTCADLISKAIAGVQFTCAKGYWNRTLARPNMYQSRYDFQYSLAWDALIFGNSYTLRTPRETGTKALLAPLDPVNVEPFGTRTMPKYRFRDSVEVYGPDRVIHIRHGGGSNLKAISRVAAGWSRVEALQSCDAEIRNVFKNGLNMSHVLHGGHADEKTLKAMLKAIKLAFGTGGEQRAGVVGLAGGFQLDTIKGITPADSDLRNLRSDLIREIAALFGIPPFAAGGSSDTKFSNVVARHAQIAKEALLPLCMNIAEALTISLGAEVTFVEEDVIRGDFGSRIEYALQAAGGAVLSPNEARETYLNRGAIEGGEDLRAGWQGTGGGNLGGGDSRGDRDPDGSENE